MRFARAADGVRQSFTANTYQNKVQNNTALLKICRPCDNLIRVMSKRNENLTRNKNQLLAWVGEIDRVIHEIAVSGTASATLSSSGGSKTYSRLNLSELRSLRAEYADRIGQINRALVAGSNPIGVRRVITVRY